MLLIVCSSSLYAQTPEEDRKRADAFFEAGDWTNATPLYSSLLSNSSLDYELNFRYGTCILYSSNKKSDAIKHLDYAVKSPSIDKRAYFYLGKAYHLNYQFKEAEQYYNKFKEQASTQQLKQLNVSVELNACRYGRNLLSDITDMIVMKKIEIGEGSFYDKYDLTTIGGQILATGDFGTKYDKKVEHRAVIHFPANSPNIFYSSYGEDGSTGLDIYQMKKLPDGKYSLPQKVRGSVNTDLDENFAYMDPNGEYLYFSSKGHNSMGGYDVFRSKYDPKTDSFGPPENMDFAISSPDDDLFYVVDAKGSVAFFASKRESKDGTVYVYEVRVERIPMQIAAIKGSFVNAIVPSNKEVAIEVEDFSSGRTVGEFNSKTANGDYFMTFPKGGKYKFYMTVKGSDITHYAVVEIPNMKELRPLKQRISLLRDETSGEQYVKIENLFDEEFDDPVTVMAEIYRELSQLKPNSDKFDLDSLDAQKDVDKVFVENGLDAFSTQDDVEFIVTEKIKDLKLDIEEDIEQSNIAYNLAEEKIDRANEKMVELNKLLDQADKTTDPKEKQIILEEAYKLNNEIKILNDDAQNLITIGKKIDQEIAEKKKAVIQGERVLDEVKKVPDGDKNALANTVNNNAPFFVEYVKDREDKPSVTEQILADGNKDVKEVNALNREIIELKGKKDDLENTKQNLNTQLANTKKKSDQEVVKKQIEEVEGDINLVDGQIISKQKDYEAVVANHGSELVNVANMVTDDKNNGFSSNLSDGQKSDIASKVTNNDLTENVAQVDKTLKDAGAGSKVNMFASDSKRDNYSLNQWTDDIDKEIKNLRDQLNTTPLDKQGPILTLINEYEDLKANKIKEFEVADNNNNTNGNNDEMVVDDIVKKFDADYQESINEIYSSQDPNDREDKIIALNNQVLNKTNERIQDLDAIIEKNPNNQEAITERNNLVKFKDQIEEDVKSPIIQPVLVDADNIEVKVNADQLMPDYSLKQNKIDQIVNEHDRRNAQNDLNRDLSTQIRNEIGQLDKIIADDPGNKDAKKRQDNLKKLDDQVNSSIVGNDKWISENPRISETVDLADIKDINPNYQERINEIDKLTNNKDKENAIENLNNETVVKINERIVQIDNDLKTNPNDPVLNKERNELDNLKTSILSDPKKPILQPENALSINTSPNINEIMPEYDGEMSNISNSIQDKEVKEQRKIDLNKNLLSKIDQEVVKLNDLKNQNPDLSGNIDKRIEGLNNIKKNKEKDILASEKIIKGNDANSRTAITIDNLMPSYESSLTQLKSDNVLNEKDKLVQENELHNQLIGNIDSKISELQDEWENNHDLNETITK